MIKRKWELFLWIPVGVLTILSVILNRYYWYFNIVAVICFACIVFLVALNRYFYIKDIKQKYDEEIDIYFVELLNRKLITREQFDNKDPQVVLGYYEPYRATRKQQILIIVCLSVVAIGILIYYFTKI